MTTPLLSDFTLYTTTPLTATDWADNFGQVVTYVTDGNYDFTINSLTTTNDVTVGGDLAVTGTVSGTFASGIVGANSLASTATYNAAQTRYYTINSTDFCVTSGASLTSYYRLFSSTSSAVSIAHCVHLPHGARITSATVYWYRNDAVATGAMNALRVNVASGTNSAIFSAGALNSNSSSGDHSVTASADYTLGLIDNENYRYVFNGTLTPNDSSGDVAIYSIVVAYEVTQPLP